MHVGIRAGTDIAFLGGLIHYVLTRDRWFKEYVLAYTNASTSLAVSFARESGQTLVGFLRDRRMNIYAHPERIF